MIYLFFGVGFAYLLALVALVIGFQKLPFFREESLPKKTRFSIVIPFRNEAGNLSNLLESLLNLNYPTSLFEVILVDDASEDESVNIINQIIEKNNDPNNLRVIKNKRHSASPKKDAIAAAIAISKYEWIVTTDADCIVPATWLTAYNCFIGSHKAALVAGPVVYKPNESIASQFQYFDGLSLQFVAMGSFGLQIPMLCNGANLAYKKETFYLVEGFSKNNHIASGDDLFMMEEILKTTPKEVHFLKSKNAIVETLPEDSWTTIIAQRIRWASKTANQKSAFSKLLGLLVFTTNALVLVGLLYCLIKPVFLPYYISFIVVKVAADYVIVKMSNTLFKGKINNAAFLPSAFSYPIVTVLVVLRSLRGSYSWKGRTFEKQP